MALNVPPVMANPRGARWWANFRTGVALMVQTSLRQMTGWRKPTNFAPSWTAECRREFILGQVHRIASPNTEKGCEQADGLLSSPRSLAAFNL
jgi:hypothetical protein